MSAPLPLSLPPFPAFPQPFSCAGPSRWHLLGPVPSIPVLLCVAFSSPFICLDWSPVCLRRSHNVAHVATGSFMIKHLVRKRETSRFPGSLMWRSMRSYFTQEVEILVTPRPRFLGRLVQHRNFAFTHLIQLSARLW